MYNLDNLVINQKIDDNEFRQKVFDKRVELIKIAEGWSGLDERGSYIFHNVWRSNDNNYVVSLGKYGKEYYQPGTTGHGVKNCNDMRPSIIKDGQVLMSVKGGFDDIFRLMERCKEDGKEDVLRAFAILFFRNALLLDHSIVDGKYYYNPDSGLIDYICSEFPSWEDVPMDVYIRFLDAIGYNEDVKYYTKGKLEKTKGIGRENNMRTYAYVICCILGYEKWSPCIYNLMKHFGVAPITNEMMGRHFPELELSYNPSVHRQRRRVNEEIQYTDVIDEMP